MHVAELDARRKNDDAVRSGHDLLRVRLDDRRGLADLNGQGRGIRGALAVGQRVGEAIDRILGRVRLRLIAIIALGIDAETAELAGYAKLAAGEARVFPACSSNGGDMGAGAVIRAGRARLRALARDHIARSRTLGAGRDRVGVVACIRLGTLNESTSVRSIFVPHNHLLPVGGAGQTATR